MWSLQSLEEEEDLVQSARCSRNALDHFRTSDASAGPCALILYPPSKYWALSGYAVISMALLDGSDCAPAEVYLVCTHTTRSSLTSIWVTTVTSQPKMMNFCDALTESEPFFCQEKIHTQLSTWFCVASSAPLQHIKDNANMSVAL